MANQRKRETDDERAARDREERIALLKMKQGLIEESEIIPETGYAEIPEQTRWEKFKTFCSLNKWFILLGAFLVAVVGVCVIQFITKEKEDIHVLVVANNEDTELTWRYEDIENALERYCLDFDENGKVNVTVNFIDHRFEDVDNQLVQVNMQRLSAELQLADAQMIIADKEFVDWMAKEDAPTKVFLDQSDKCEDDMLYKDVGVLMGHTGLAKEARWSKCPDSVVILVREELNNGSGNIKSNAEKRERASTVLQNILDGNIVNPKTTSE